MTEPLETIANHVSQFIGPVIGMLELGKHYEGAPDIRLLHVPATEDKPFQVLVSAGMSSKPMAIPEGANTPDRIELIMGLPTDFDLSEDNPDHIWPVQLLAGLAHFPTELGAWFGVGHSIPNGEPPESYAPNCQFCCAVIAPALSMPLEGQSCRCSGHDVYFRGVVPIFKHEMELKMEKGVQTLFQRFDKENITEVLDPRRASVAGTLVELLKEN